MNMGATAVSIVFASWTALALPGCFTPGGEEKRVDARSASPVTMNEPIANYQFDFTTPTFSDNHHVVTRVDFEKLNAGMTMVQVEALLGRKCDLGDCPGGGLGGINCIWYEDDATIGVAFGFRGEISQMSFTPTTHNERPDWLRRNAADAIPK